MKHSVQFSKKRRNTKNKKYKKTMKKSLRGGGTPVNVGYHDKNLFFLTLSQCVKELLDISYKIYKELLEKPYPITLVCGGQSPSYYCLAMMNFSIFNPDKVEILILPHSKGGQKSRNQYTENKLYCERLKEKGIKLREHVVILDGVHSGVGILALQSALEDCFPSIKVSKYAINYNESIAEIPVEKTFVAKCEPRFSDIYKRLIPSYYPHNFNNGSKFTTAFQIEGNPLAEMIIDLAKLYPDNSIESSEWYILNDVVTPEIEKLREEKKVHENLNRQRNELQKKFKNLDNSSSSTFVPIILHNTYGKIYECPICHFKSGTFAPLHPEKTEYFPHHLLCPNKNKVPVEDKGLWL